MSYDKPLPVVEDWNQGFWEAAKRHELVIQQCSDCKTFRHFPRAMCPECNSMKFDWVKVSGKGKVYTWCIVEHPYHPAFADLPLPLIIVELDDIPDVHLVSNIVDSPVEDIQIGMPVEVVFDDVTEEITLPRFRPVSK